MKPIFLFVLSWILACSSGGNSRQDQYEMAPSKMATPSMDQNEGGYSSEQHSDIEIASAKIIRDGRMYLKVDNIETGIKSVNAIIAKFQARASGEQFENTDYQSTYYVRVRVPASRLDSLVAAVEEIEGTVTSKTLDARDVTEEYIDLETRLDNKRSYLEQYRQLLKSARTTEDVLKVTEQIRQLEEELESVEGRLRYLSDQVAMSTLELTLTQSKDYVFRPEQRANFFERLKKAMSGGWFAFVDFTLAVLSLWPFWLLLGIFLILLRRYSRKKRNTA